MASLFDDGTEAKTQDKVRPLPDLLRPSKLDDVIGQDHLISDGKPLRRMTDSGNIASLVFWGPPGCGKTTLARILSQHTDLHFEQISWTCFPE
mgnify:FL=1